MNKQAQIEQFVQSIGNDTSFWLLADILDIDHNTDHWLDDDFPQKMDEMAVEVIDALTTMVEEYPDV